MAVLPLDKKRAGARNRKVAVKKKEAELPEQPPSMEKILKARRSRPAWSGTFNASELLRPGGMLMSALVACAAERGQKLEDVAAEVGVTYGYLNQLQTGRRKVWNLASETAEMCALYLGVPTMTVLFMAGRLKLRYAYEKPNLLEAEIPRAIEYIRRDREYGYLVNSDILNGNFDTQYLVVRLYQQATNKKLLPDELEHLDAAKLAAELEQVERVRTERLAQMEVLRLQANEDGEEA